MKIKINAYVHFCKFPWQDNGTYEIFCMELKDDEHRTYVCQQEVEIEVPDNYDPRPQQIAALEEQKRKAMAEFQKTVDDINERISKLQAISYEPTVTV
mgnify:CR=1 FL=1